MQGRMRVVHERVKPNAQLERWVASGICCAKSLSPKRVTAVGVLKPMRSCG